MDANRCQNWDGLLVSVTTTTPFVAKGEGTVSLSAISVRRLRVMLSALALAAVGFLVVPAAAYGATPNYPAPSVDPAVQTGVPTAATDPGIELASNNGSDFAIGMPFVIGALVLLTGLALTIMMTRPSKAKHYRR